MNCTFIVGDKVTLIEPIQSQNRGGYGDERYPEFGEIYTIREIEAIGDRIGLRFVEIVNPIRVYRYGTAEGMFSHYRFRRVINTDISDLQEIARKVFETEREPLPMGVIR